MDEHFDESYERFCAGDEASEPGTEGSWAPEDLTAPESWTIQDFDDVIPLWGVGSR